LGGCLVCSFNPRPRTGGDLSGWGCAGTSGRFQSTPPHGGRRGRHALPPPVRSFNPRPRTGGDPMSPRRCLKVSCFNPRPRTGGDESRRTAAGGNLRVSIHAPARGATDRRWCRCE